MIRLRKMLMQKLLIDRLVTFQCPISKLTRELFVHTPITIASKPKTVVPIFCSHTTNVLNFAFFALLKVDNVFAIAVVRATTNFILFARNSR